MSTSTTTRRFLQPTRQSAAVAGLAVAGVIVFVGNYRVPAGQNGGTGPGLISAVGCLVVAGIVYGAVLPRVRAVNRASLILGALAVVSLPAFWSGVTPVLASAAIAVSAAGPTSRPARIAQVAAVVAAGLAVAVTVAGSSLL